MNQLLIQIKDKDIVQQLEAFQIEVDGKQNILTHMINNNMNDSIYFKNYEQEYFLLFNAYNKKKQELQQLFINPILKENNINPEKAFWTLDFNTEEVTLTYEI